MGSTLIEDDRMLTPTLYGTHFLTSVGWKTEFAQQCKNISSCDMTSTRNRPRIGRSTTIYPLCCSCTKACLGMFFLTTYFLLVLNPKLVSIVYQFHTKPYYNITTVKILHKDRSYMQLQGELLSYLKILKKYILKTSYKPFSDLFRTLPNISDSALWENS